MVVDLDVPIRTVKDNTTFGIDDGGKSFPILQIDKGSYICNGSKIESWIDFDFEGGIHNLQIGRYTSVAEDVLFMIDMNHDYLSVFQGYVPAIDGDNIINQKDRLRRKGQIIIQNDCWIGHGATIMGGITVHNGAVVAANAVVTKDVPPYTIVGGNPARIIGKRFSDSIIQKLNKIQWWYWSDDQLRENEKYLRGDVRIFADKFDVEEGEPHPSPVARLTEGSRFVYYLDMNEVFPVWRRVISQFAETFDKTQAELLLYLDPGEKGFEENGARLLDYLETYQDFDVYINIYTEPMREKTELLQGAEYYITNRLADNLYKMCAAEKQNIKCISGVDSDIFYGVL
jgi:virginiamycin A acetyltransferase